ncbi:MAG TPA: energy transducer TonB [Gemmatimonadales bacterium]|nr:energy transducer TonB [Gemmatimonadales bacterium]
MTPRRAALAALVAVVLAACGKKPSADQAGSGVGGGAGGGEPADQEPPVALNGDSPIQYPPRLYDQRVEGDVVLRLFVDSLGALRPESSRVAESSGYPVLDSAALSGARRLRFAPARRHGLPIATAFLQPIEFRHPQASGAMSKGAPDTARALSPSPSPPVSPPPPRPAPARVPIVRPSPQDTAAARRDTSSRILDTTRSRPDSARTKSDTNAVPH